MYETLQHIAASDSGIATSSSSSSSVDTPNSESASCACNGRPKCNDCKRKRTRRQTEKHRDNKKSERAQFLAERDYERRRNFELRGQLQEAQRSFAEAIQPRRVTCPSCKNIFLSDEQGTPVADVERDKNFDDRIEECQKFLSGLKSPVASHQQRHTTKESKSTECRRNKDRNFQRCIDLLQWALDKLSKLNGQIVNLRHQKDAALKQFFFSVCPVCRFQAPSTGNDQTAPCSTGILAPHYNSQYFYPVCGSNNAYSAHSQRSLPNMLVGAGVNSMPSHFAYDTPQPEYTFLHPPTLPQPPSYELAVVNEEPDWDSISELLNDQPNATAPSALPSGSDPHDARFRIAYAFSDNVFHKPTEGVDEIEDWLSTFRIASDKCESERRQTLLTTAQSSYVLVGMHGKKVDHTHDSEYVNQSTAGSISRSVPSSALPVNIMTEAGKKEWDVIEEYPEHEKIVYYMELNKDAGEDSSAGLNQSRTAKDGRPKEPFRARPMTPTMGEAKSEGDCTSTFTISTPKNIAEAERKKLELDSSTKSATGTQRDNFRHVTHSRAPAGHNILVHANHPIHLEITDDEIGSGSFANVYKGVVREGAPGMALPKINGTDEDDDRVVAVKIGQPKHKDSLLKDIRAMLEIGVHSSIVALIGVTCIGDNPVLVLEYCANGDLLRYLRTPEARSMCALEMCLKICDGMAFIASKGFVHRDLAARNIFLNAEMTPKIGDFGLAMPYLAEGYVMQHGTMLPLRWTAPESINGTFNEESDVWSYGVLLYEIFSFGNNPYDHVAIHELIKYLREGNRLEQPESCPDEIYKMMRRTWDGQPNNRPSFGQLREELRYHVKRQ